MVRPKVQASSSRVGDGAGFTFGSSSFGGGGFATTLSPFSYLAELPDVNKISDPQLVVIFKNLVKKDATTKARALEELQAHLTAVKNDKSLIQDAVLDVWVALYPRTSIDNTRRVRSLAQIVQGLLAQLVGKRLTRYLPKLAGPWSLGCHDTDQGVATATQDALQTVFVGDKLQLFRKAYHPQILQTCADLAESESAKSLSDERIVSHDEAVAKYDRVVAAATGLLISIITELDSQERVKLHEQYCTLLSSNKLWQSVASTDAAVRRNINLLLRTMLKTDDLWSSIDTITISNSFIETSLKTNQSSTATDLVAVLVDLTLKSPVIWTTDWKSKKPAHARLRQFVKGGSCGGPRSYWQDLAALLNQMPQAAFPSSAEDAQKFVEAYQQGISGRSEPRAYQTNAYLGFLKAVVPMTSNVQDQNEYLDLLKATLLPVVEALILPQADMIWSLPLDAVPVLSHEAMMIRNLPSLLCQQWPTVTAQVIDMLKKTLPESSKNYTSSQEFVKETGLRWTLATKELHTKAGSQLNDQLTIKALLWESSGVCSLRDGKPYAAAVIVQVMVKHLNQIVWQESAKRDILDQFIQKSVARLIMSPSSSALCTILQAAHERPYFRDVWRKCIDNITQSDLGQAAATQALAGLLSIAQSTDPSLLEDMRVSALSERLLSQTMGGTLDWPAFATMLKSLKLHTTNVLLTQMASKLSARNEQMPGTVKGLQLITKEAPVAMEQFTSTEEGQQMLRQLLLLAEDEDDKPDSVTTDLNDLIGNLTINNAVPNGNLKSVGPMVAAILDSLGSGGLDAVSVDVLVSQAINLLKSQQNISVRDLLPDREVWQSELRSFLSTPPYFAIDILNSVSGTIFVINQGDNTNSTAPRVTYDRDGTSIPLRKAMYALALLKQARSSGRYRITDEDVNLIVLTGTLVNENVSYWGSNEISATRIPSDDNRYTKISSDTYEIISWWIEDAATRWNGNTQDAESIDRFLEQLLHASSEPGSIAFYMSHLYETLVFELISKYGLPQSRVSALPNTILKLRRSENLLQTAAFVSVHRDFLSSIPVCKSWYNALVAETTGLDFTTGKDKAIKLLYLLNIFLATMGEAFIESAAQQRLVFLFRHIISGLESTMDDSELQTLMLSITLYLCEPLRSVYGDYWETVLTYIQRLWQDCSSLTNQDRKSADLNRIFESQRLYRALRRVARLGDCNEDLTDAFAAASTELGQGLLHLISLDYDQDDQYNQPLRQIRTFTAIELRKSYMDLQIEPDTLYPIIHASNPETQAYAFVILHKSLPERQLQISLDVAIEKETASISDELLSLTLDAPEKIDIRELDDATTQSLVKRYFYSWILVFDHFTNASHQLQVMYLESIKMSADLGALLNSIYGLLRQTKYLPAKTLSFDVANYEVDPGSTPQQDIPRLACHLYYLSLVHASSLAKTWWLNAHRTVAASMETFTENHITPLVISRAFTELEEWTRDQSANSSADDRPLSIKANRSSREVIASVVIGGEDDERSVSICVSLPSTFPLKAATVLSRSTTSTFEARKWQSWLMIAQGAITFNNNSIADGLLAWRRNVTGALHGKSECTICYSLVSEDGRLPNKECKTCKHAFHMICLTKWFSSSGDKKCPLCRSDFVGLGRVDRGGRRSTRED